MCFAYLLTGTKGMHFGKLLLIQIPLLYTPVLCHVVCMWKRFPCPVIVCCCVGVWSYVLCLYICDCMYVNSCCVESRGGCMWYVLEWAKFRSESSRARRSEGRKMLHLISLSLSPLFGLYILRCRYYIFSKTFLFIRFYISFIGTVSICYLLTPKD